MSVPGATAHTYVASGETGDRIDLKLQLHHLSSPDERNPNKLVLDTKPGFSIGVVHQQPFSGGAIHLASPNPLLAPTIRAGYFSDERDLPMFIRGVRLIRRVAAQPSLASIIVRESRPSAARESDLDLADYLRDTIFSSYHPIGTCRMGVDERADVDARLKVRGVDHLYVADASIFPTMPASNTNAAAIMVGERAAHWLSSSR